ncbi:hypothetical protein, partial [Vibrio splendidus]|uniref:hypothetical protein n=1 Tax=Vibrio splendidus TaxID=29497 RepID=UPI001A95DE3D
MSSVSGLNILYLHFGASQIWGVIHIKAFDYPNNSAVNAEVSSIVHVYLSARASVRKLVNLTFIRHKKGH